MKKSKTISLIIGCLIGLFFAFYFTAKFFKVFYIDFQPPIIIRTPVIINRWSDILPNKKSDQKQHKNSQKQHPTPTVRQNIINRSKGTSRSGATGLSSRGSSPALMAIYVYFGKDKVAQAIAQAESGLNCKRVSKEDDRGLFQINWHYHSWRFKKQKLNWSDCWANAKVASQIYKEQGWYPWSVYKNKSYLKFL